MRGKNTNISISAKWEFPVALPESFRAVSADGGAWPPKTRWEEWGVKER